MTRCASRLYRIRLFSAAAIVFGGISLVSSAPRFSNSAPAPPPKTNVFKSIKISGPSHVKEGHTAYYTCTLTGDDGTTDDVTGQANWTTDCWWAGFESAGRLKAREVTANQWCRITASTEGLSDSLDITIEDVIKRIVRLEIDGPSSMKEDSTAYLRCRVHYDDGSTEDVSTKASWSVSTWSATVDNGKVTASSVTANVWCKVTAAFERASVDFDLLIENSEIKVAGIKITGPKEIDMGQSGYFTCTATYDDGSTEDVSSSAGWSVDSWYATITGSGKLETKEVPSDQWVKIHAVFRGASETHEVKIRRIDVQRPSL